MTFQSYFECKTTERSLNNFTIELLDEDRNYINMNGLDWIITLDIKKYNLEKKQNDVFDEEPHLKKTKFNNQFLNKKFKL